MTRKKPATADALPARALEQRIWAQVEAGQSRAAIAACEQLNREHPDYAPGWHTASRLALQLNNLPIALSAIDRALALEPNATPWLLQRGLCLAKLRRIPELEAVVATLAGRNMTSAYECSTLALLYTELGRRGDAVELYESAARLNPDEPKHYYNLACLQRSLGDIAAAERNFDRTLELDPADYEAMKIRSELRTQTADNNHVDALEELLHAGLTDPRGKTQVCYALAKELEDLGEHERSFRYLKQGADSRRSYMRYDVQRDIDTMASIRDVFSVDLFEQAHAGIDNDEPIFIVGMPRTGTTLVERILASHSDVFAAGELTNFAVEMMRLARQAAGDRQLDRNELVQLTAELDFAQLGKAYVDGTRPFTGHTPKFIDKLPLNFLYVGLIRLALPNAKIVNLVRHPLDTCYAIYKQLFVDAYPFSYDLVELARYYAAYDQLMRHWDTVLPGVIHKVTYESLVADQETEARRLVDSCGLDWQSQCLALYENPEASLTASTVQVRKPVYSSSVGKWRHYREQLEPLAKTLRDAGIAIND
ncbi:MAG: sulfotransferase [Woeseiaceae bacterium]|nr:sulfotransferase [Woeseiaceae bacterium]